MIFAFIAAEKAHFPVRVLCRTLAVSPSGYYAAQQRPPSRRAQMDTTLLRRLHLTHAESRAPTVGRGCGAPCARPVCASATAACVA